MVGFGIVTGLLFLVMAAVLELNKNTLLGFALLVAATVGFAVLFSKVFQGGKWYGKLLGYAGYLAAFALILFLTWPPTRAVPAYEGKAPVYTEPVTIEKGTVRGVVVADGAVELYAGIPYAQPPVRTLCPGRASSMGTISPPCACSRSVCPSTTAWPRSSASTTIRYR